jgi:hypothetical protein
LAEALSLHHDIVKRLMMEELNLRQVNFKWVPHTLTASQKLESIKGSRTFFGQFNKDQVTDLARVIRDDETWAYSENPRSAMWVEADGRSLNRPKQLIGTKKVMF